MVTASPSLPATEHEAHVYLIHAINEERYAEGSLHENENARRVLVGWEDVAGLQAATTLRAHEGKIPWADARFAPTPEQWHMIEQLCEQRGWHASNALIRACLCRVEETATVTVFNKWLVERRDQILAEMDRESSLGRKLVGSGDGEPGNLGKALVLLMRQDAAEAGGEFTREDRVCVAEFLERHPRFAASALKALARIVLAEAKGDRRHATPHNVSHRVVVQFDRWERVMRFVR
ncbi:hypothetical protein HYS28_00960 [Candidatus Uhrbacteria bacterium]|nr:hypothetical protein [Candidatus Uhrbacteria bacterium]